MSPLPTDGDLDEAAELTARALRAQEQGEYAEAARLFQQALAIHEHVMDPNQLTIAASLDDLARLYQEQHTLFSPHRSVPLSYERALDYLRAPMGEDQALPLYERALAIREQVLGPEHLDVVASLDNLAGRHVELAQELAHHSLFSLSERIQQLGPIHTQVFSSLPPMFQNTLSGLVEGYREHLSNARSLYQRALDIRQRSLGSNHPDVAATLIRLARLEEDQHTQGTVYERLQQMFTRREWWLREKTWTPADIPWRSEDEKPRDVRQDEQSLAYLQQALRILEQTQPDSPHMAGVLEKLADTYWDQGKKEQAIAYWERALTMLERELGPADLYVTTSMETLADRYRDLKRDDRAVALYERLLSIREQMEPNELDAADWLDTADLMERVAHMLDGLHHSSRADELRERAQAIRDQQDG
jgi:tetratricopeptide (TPR) repeat protein